MAVFQSEDRQRMRRLRSEKAIQLAMQNKWQEAADLNRQILEHFPDDVDTLNRLGKALMELGQYAESRDQYARATKADPSNGIAAKNLVRLTKLAEEAAASPAVAVPPAQRVDPSLFIEESGKTAVTDLVDRAPFPSIATLTAGDKLTLKVENGVVRIIGPGDIAVGQLEPKIGQRVIRLVEAGNRYSAAITSIDEHHVRVIIREEFRDPSMRSRPSFPTQQGPEIRPYTKDNIFRTDIDDEDDDVLDDVEVDAESGDVAEADATSSKDADDDDDEDDDRTK
jgi:tetratricopeptide (TPR) repeat protein